MKLDHDNYFSDEANRAYFSVSQFKDFQTCEAAAMARINGEYTPQSSTAQLVGSFIHAHFAGERVEFELEHPEIFTARGKLRAEFEHANNVIIPRILSDKFMMKYLAGETEVIKTGEWLGVPWKIKMDVYHPGLIIVDLKIMKDFDDVYVAGQGRIPFVEAWGYDLQAAVYRAVEGNGLPFAIMATTKQPIPDIAALLVPEYQINFCTSLIAQKLPRMIEVKTGKAEPKRCGRCEYCRATKTITEIISYDELNSEEE
jgi:hypothetical protein